MLAGLSYCAVRNTNVSGQTYVINYHFVLSHMNISYLHEEIRDWTNKMANIVCFLKLRDFLNYFSLIEFLYKFERFPKSSR